MIEYVVDLTDELLKKVGEECAETIIAAKNGDKEELVGEINDVSSSQSDRIFFTKMKLPEVSPLFHSFWREREKNHAVPVSIVS